MVEDILKQRKRPSLLTFKNGKGVKTKKGFEGRRRELKEILQREVFGLLPPPPKHLFIEKAGEEGAHFLAGFATCKKLLFHCEINGADAIFPVTQMMPKREGRVPVFVFYHSETDPFHSYVPIEEILDHGYGLFLIEYEEVAKDSTDFRYGMAKHLCQSRRALSATGKIAMWAWAAIRVMDYIPRCPSVDSENVAVIGHAALGQAGLLAGAMDVRFRYVISNDGCAGETLSRFNNGERFPFRFCPRYRKHIGKESEMPFAAHFLLSLIAPRHLMIGAAEDALWADAKNDFLCIAAANEAYGIYGLSGLVHNGEFPPADTELDEGDCLYHYRRGTQYLSRRDWNAYISFIDKKRNNKKTIPPSSECCP